MSRTYRKSYTTSLVDRGGHSHHNSLSKEFNEVDKGGCCIKRTRGLLDRRDYDSDRNKAIRTIMTKKRRIVLKRNTEKFIEEELTYEGDY